MSKATDNMQRRRDEAHERMLREAESRCDEIARRAQILFAETPRQGDERACLFCSRRFSNQGHGGNLLDHLKEHHGAAILSMPEARFARVTTAAQTFTEDRRA